jgi:ankyrin repeat protein
MNMRTYCTFAAILMFGPSMSAQNAPDELIQLIRNNNLSELKTRLTKGADVNTRDARGNTLLMEAAAFGSIDAMKMLLAAGADVNAKNQFDSTPLLLAAGNNEKARLLIERGADVNAKTKSGRTPLMIAATCAGCAPTLKLLIEKGANVQAIDQHKVGALRLAADADDLESIKLLLAKGADPKASDDAGNDAMQSAANNCNLEASRLLLSKGASPNTANTFGGEVKFGKIQLIGLTPLMLASTYCSPQLVKTLLDAGANIKAIDVRGMTPLHFAISSEIQDLAVVRLLIQAGAEVNAKSKAGETALDWAKKFGHSQIIRALEEAGGKEAISYAPPQRKSAGEGPVLRSVEKGTALLQNSATEFFKQSGCVGCHHQPATLSAVSAARLAGVKVGDDAARAYIKMMEGQSQTFQQPMIERGDIGGLTDGPVLFLLAMHGEHYPASPLTDVLVNYVGNYQRRDGSWWFGGVARPPAEEGSLPRTALAMRALQVYSTPGMKADLDRRIAKAAAYLAKTTARTTDEAAMQVAGLHWAPGSEDKMRTLARALLGAQHADGGWSPNPDLPSDAYATGETLWALNEAGTLKPSDPAYQKGVRYLLGIQWEDGSWYVRSRSPKFQPYFQSGFPFEHDQWISSAATSWAIRALAPAVESR